MDKNKNKQLQINVNSNFSVHINKIEAYDDANQMPIS